MGKWDPAMLSHLLRTRARKGQCRSSKLPHRRAWGLITTLFYWVYFPGHPRQTVTPHPRQQPVRPHCPGSVSEVLRSGSHHGSFLHSCDWFREGGTGAGDPGIQGPPAPTPTSRAGSADLTGWDSAPFLQVQSRATTQGPSLWLCTFIKAIPVSWWN